MQKTFPDQKNSPKDNCPIQLKFMTGQVKYVLYEIYGEEKRTIVSLEVSPNI